ncbi:hypothetical protein N7523_010247 [Penicillium sp. IBT 18751x]|nr:hypothetical protein N7523_010247 [Penicillium sp. IBT 18751x]
MASADTSGRRTRNGDQTEQTQTESWIKEHKSLCEEPNPTKRQKERISKLRERLEERGLLDKTVNPQNDLSPSENDSSRQKGSNDASDSMEGVEFNGETPKGPEIADGSKFAGSDGTGESHAVPNEAKDPQARIDPRRKPVDPPRKHTAGGIPEAYSRCNSWRNCSRLLYRYGGEQEATYGLGPPEKYTEKDLGDLPLISGKNVSVLDITDDHGNRLYGYRNIEKVLNVASVPPSPKKRTGNHRKRREPKASERNHISPRHS